MTGHCKHRIAGRTVSGVQESSLDVFEVSSSFHIGADQIDPPAIVGSAPDPDGLAGKHTVGETYYENPFWLEDSVNLDKCFYGPGQILDGDCDHHGIEYGVSERKHRIAVYVVNDDFVEGWVGFHFFLVEAQSDQAFLGVIVRPMRAPTAHQIEDN